MQRHRRASPLVAATLALAAYGCVDPIECAEGTFEVDGRCVAGELPPPAACGPGTHFDFEIAMCVPDLPPTRCDESTTDVVVDEQGVAVCVGNAPPGCNGPIVCPSPAAGKVTVCGQLVDLETRDAIEAADPSGLPCPAEPTADGPCSLQLELVDALAFAGNPDTPPLTVDQVVVDDCGRFKAVNVELPFSRTIGVAVDDAPGVADVHALTGVAFIGESGRQTKDLNAYATRHSTDEQWTATADAPFGAATFGQHGVYVALFLYRGAPVEGVRVTAGGALVPNRDYYFSDPDDDLTTVDPSLDATGPNGAALLVDSQLGNHSGTGGEVDACTWESSLATAIATVVFVQERHLVDATDEECQ